MQDIGRTTVTVTLSGGADEIFAALDRVGLKIASGRLSVYTLSRKQLRWFSLAAVQEGNGDAARNDATRVQHRLSREDLHRLDDAIVRLEALTR